MSVEAPSLHPEAEAEIEYRRINPAAVAAIVLGVVSPLIFLAGRDSLQGSLLFAPLPLLGLGAGLRSLSRIHRNPDQFAGGKLALVGSALCLLSLVGGLAFSGYVYATEVPDGYVRTSFAEMKPDEVEMRGDIMVPPDVAALDGKKVFIKGYIRPDSTPYRQNINRFLLVRDNQQCCFGDISTVNYFDQMAVALGKDYTLNYSPGVFRMGGTLHINPRNIGRGQPVYTLDADYAN